MIWKDFTNQIKTFCFFFPLPQLNFFFLSILFLYMKERLIYSLHTQEHLYRLNILAGILLDYRLKCNKRIPRILFIKTYWYEIVYSNLRHNGSMLISRIYEHFKLNIKHLFSDEYTYTYLRILNKSIYYFYSSWVNLYIKWMNLFFVVYCVFF